MPRSIFCPHNATYFQNIPWISLAAKKSKDMMLSLLQFDRDGVQFFLFPQFFLFSFELTCTVVSKWSRTLIFFPCALVTYSLEFILVEVEHWRIRCGVAFEIISINNVTAVKYFCTLLISYSIFTRTFWHQSTLICQRQKVSSSFVVWWHLYSWMNK